MRGKQNFIRRASTEIGLIPAHAGKTATSVSGESAGAAHPRACGENYSSSSGRSGSTGSSPRMRGKLFGGGQITEERGLIPAHAGKTHKALAFFPGRRAHPRACGENNSGMVWTFSSSGSSPRMRGKQRVSCCYPRVARLIPAHAGKTLTICLAPRHLRAHPRACGENLGR